MRRFTSLVIALGLAGAVTAGAVAACGGHPAHPGEAPPLAPRPEPGQPAATRLIPLPTTDGGAPTPLHPGPVSMTEVPSPELHAAAQETDDAGAPPPSDDAAAPAPAPAPPVDAGVEDTYELPPIPDGSIPADARVEPARAERR